MPNEVRVIVGGGHGGSNSTPGKRSPDGTYEWNYNDTVVDAFIDELDNYEGVLIKRVDDDSGRTDVPLATRTTVANNWGADYYFSFHQNAYKGVWGSHGGTETFHGSSAESKRIAKLVQDTLLEVYGLRNRGLKDGNHLWVIKKTPNIPTILTEGGFMDSTTDIVVLRNKALLAEGGRRVAKRFAEYKGLKLRKAVTVNPAPSKAPTATQELYRVRATWADVKSQKGAFYNLAHAKDLADKHKGYEVYDSKGTVIYPIATPPKPAPTPAPKPVTASKPSYIGKRVESKVGALRYYSRPSWKNGDVVGTLGKGIGFPTILDRIVVDGAYQYRVKNSKGAIFYVTASDTYVKVL